jgi:hypothetical protein
VIRFACFRRVLGRHCLSEHGPGNGVGAPEAKQELHGGGGEVQAGDHDRGATGTHKHSECIWSQLPSQHLQLERPILSAPKPEYMKGFGRMAGIHLKVSARHLLGETG